MILSNNFFNSQDFLVLLIVSFFPPQRFWQLILNYKMEYASYLESLQPEQRVLELKNSQPKALGAKRSPAKTKQVWFLRIY